jgi:YD repeat-containing protein
VTQGTRTSTLAYDALGNLASISDPAHRTTSFGYDLAGRVTNQVLPDGRQIVFAYDGNGNVRRVAGRHVAGCSVPDWSCGGWAEAV